MQITQVIFLQKIALARTGLSAVPCFQNFPKEALNIFLGDIPKENPP
jgi:hypothetical protein